MNILAFTIQFLFYFSDFLAVRVVFTATVTQSFTSPSGHTIVFPNVLSSTGGGYNHRNGVFTAPIGGLYFFFCKITSQSDSDMVFEFILNGSPQTTHLVYGRSEHSYRTSSNAIVLQLNRGDAVWIKMLQGGVHYTYHSGGDQTFMGFLL